MKDDDLYEKDFYEWLCRQQSLLYQRRFDELDVEHPIDELEGIANRLWRDLCRAIADIMAFLILRDSLHDPEVRGNLYDRMVSTAAYTAASVIEEAPSLEDRLRGSWDAVWHDAVFKAILVADELGVESFTVHTRPPWTVDEFLAKHVFMDEEE